MPAKLVEVPKRVQEGVGPGIAAAGGVGDLGEPVRLAGLELVPEPLVEGQGLVRALQPVFRERRLGRGLRPLALRGALSTSRQWSTGRASIPLQLLRKLGMASALLLMDEVDTLQPASHREGLSYQEMAKLLGSPRWHGDKPPALNSAHYDVLADAQCLRQAALLRK